MSYYKSGMVIKLAREASGMSQEELAENICAVQTLSRIENGKTGVKRETYRQLMNKLEAFSERNYAICTGEDLKVMEYKEYIDDSIRMHQYDEAEAYLKKLEQEEISGRVHKQYIIWSNAVIKIALGKISPEENLSELKKALELTVPNYEKYFGKVYPFTLQETLILMNIGNNHMRREGKEEKERAIKIYDMLSNNLSYSYMSQQDADGITIVVNYNKMKALTGLGKFREAYEIGERLLKLSRECCYTVALPVIIGEMAWDISREIKYGRLDISYKEKVYHHLQAAYYIAAANGDDIIKEIIEKDLQELV